MASGLAGYGSEIPPDDPDSKRVARLAQNIRHCTWAVCWMAHAVVTRVGIDVTSSANSNSIKLRKVRMDNMELESKEVDSTIEKLKLSTENYKLKKQYYELVEENMLLKDLLMSKQ